MKTLCWPYLCAAAVVLPGFAGSAGAAIKLQAKIKEAADGVEVREVEKKGVAAQLGMQPGDVIKKVNATKIDSIKTLTKALDDDSITVTWQRGDKFYRNDARALVYGKDYHPDAETSVSGKRPSRPKHPRVEYSGDDVETDKPRQVTVPRQARPRTQNDPAPRDISVNRSTGRAKP